MHPACMASQPSPCASSNAAMQKKRAFLGKKRVVSAAGLINTNNSLSRLYLPPIPLAPQSSSLVRKTPLTFFLTRTKNACSSSSTPKEIPSPPSSPLALPLGSSLATLLKLVSLARCPHGKWSRLDPAPRR